MSRFLKVCDVNVANLAAELDAQPELWDTIRWRKELPSGPHARMSDIWVRYNDIRPYRQKGSFEGFNAEHDSVWYPAYDKLPSLKSILPPLMMVVEGERLGGVLITRIPSTCGIDPHIDVSWHVDYYDKFYVSVKSAPGAVFASEEEVLNPTPGECWRFDNRLRHWVHNGSSEDRITLIVCIRTEKYRAEHERFGYKDRYVRAA